MSWRAKASPIRSNRGCLCKNGTYSIKCCQGKLHQQGIGNIYRIKETTAPNKMTITDVFVQVLPQPNQMTITNII